MAIAKIKKRNGEIVDFSPEKITIVISKAFVATRGAVDVTEVHRMTTAVVEELERTFAEALPSVEDVQDLVERRLMADNYPDVAKAYIIYRYEHAKEREEKKRDVLEKIEKNDLFVVKRNGERERFSIEKLRRSLVAVTRDYEHIVDVDALISQCQADLYDGISTRDIARTLMMTARSFIEQDPAYSRVAARLLLRILYKEVIGAAAINFAILDEQYRESFARNIKRAVEIGKIDPRMLVFDLEKLSMALRPERDDLFMYLGVQVLYDRYFLRVAETQEILETPQAFWMRVAMGLAINEADKTGTAIKFYEILSTLRYVASTPTLFHSGMVRAQLSSCFINTVPDDLHQIFKSYGDNAQLLKWAGGTGTDWTPVRATGALIKAIGVESQGVIPFLKIANDTTISINRSGRRRGAACVYLETWHYDIEDFLELRKNTGDERRRAHDIDTANWIPDLFIKRIRDDGDWTLFSPDEAPDLHDLYGKKFEERYTEYERMAQEGKMRLTKKLKARDLWKKMLAMLYETGHPWITFKDPCNVRSPQDHVGVVHSSNLCTEITLNNSQEETAVCNLGSVNLVKHIRDHKLDAEMVKDTVETAMRMLDNVIDLNYYPTPETKTSNMRHRPVGLGIMGFQDALYLMDINFDSEACVQFADESMEMISFYAIGASAKLAHERGAYASYKGSKWDRGILPQDTLQLLEAERGEAISVSRESRMNWDEVRALVRQYGMRNSNCLAIAPTATISNIAGSSPSIEPIYKNLYVKSNMSGDFIVINPYLVEDLKKLNLWDYEMLGKIKYRDGSIAEVAEIPQHLKDKYKEVFEIDPKWLIRAAAHRGKWIDQSQSLNIFFRGSSGKVVSDIYMYAWEMGLKTTYYLRTLAASQVEKATINQAEFGTTHTRRQATLSPVRAALSVTAEVPTGPVAAVATSAFSQRSPATPAYEAQPAVKVFEFEPGSGAAAENVASGAMQIKAHLPPKAAPAEQSKKELKLCLIDDPMCEACQ